MRVSRGCKLVVAVGIVMEAVGIVVERIQGEVAGILKVVANIQIATVATGRLEELVDLVMLSSSS